MAKVLIPQVVSTIPGIYKIFNKTATDDEPGPQWVSDTNTVGHIVI